MPPRQLEGGRRVERGGIPAGVGAPVEGVRRGHRRVAGERGRGAQPDEPARSGARSSSSAGPLVATARPASRHFTGAPTSMVRSNPVVSGVCAWRLWRTRRPSRSARRRDAAPRRPDRRSSRQSTVARDAEPAPQFVPSDVEVDQPNLAVAALATSSTVIRTDAGDAFGQLDVLRAAVLADRHRHRAGVRGQPHLGDVGPAARCRTAGSPARTSSARRTAPRSTGPPAS